jgi:hypothetical protein
VQTLERRSFDLEHENDELRENLLKMQTHSMKYNLIFGGISDKDCETENTEIVLKYFLQIELEITGVEDIEFQNVHRLLTRKDGKPRNIARFTNYRDHEKVRQAASTLKEKPEFTISQQDPQDIVDRRLKLYPKLKEFQRQWKRATMVYDQLIVNGYPYVPRPRAEPPYPMHNPDHDNASDSLPVPGHVYKLNFTHLNVCGNKSTLLNLDFDTLIIIMMYCYLLKQIF